MKPVARAHFAQDLRWHSTLEDSASVDTTPDVGNAGLVGGMATGDFVAARYGSGARLNVASQYVTFSTSDLDPAKGAIEFWLQPNWDSTDSAWHDIGGFARRERRLDTGQGDATTPCTSGSRLRSHFETEVDSPNYSWRADDWVHLRIEWDESAPPATQLRLLVNGVEPPNSDIGGDYVGTLSRSGPATGSATPSGTPRLACVFDEVHFYGGSSARRPRSARPRGAHHRRERVPGGRGQELLAALRGRRRAPARRVPLRSAPTRSSTASTCCSPRAAWARWRPATWTGSTGTGRPGRTWRRLRLHRHDEHLRKPGNLYWTGDPFNWAPYSVNGGPDLYYVRAYLPRAPTRPPPWRR